MTLKSALYQALRWHNDYTAIRKGRIGSRIRNKLIGRMMGRLMRRRGRMNLTAEQREALGAGGDALENLLDDWEIAEDEQANATLLRHILVIRDLLAASKPAWEITEERKKALRVAVGDMDLSKNIHYLGVIRNMLEEAE